MGAMSQLYADTQEHQQQIKTLRNELRIAARRLDTAAAIVDTDSRAGLLRKWASEAREALENA